MRSIVLRPTVDHERTLAFVNVNCIKLPDGKIIEMQPSHAAIVGHEQPAVIRKENAIWFLGVDPHVIMVEMHGMCLMAVKTNDFFIDWFERLPRIFGRVDAIAQR